MIAGLVGMAARNIAAWSVRSREETGPPINRAYYGWVIMTIAALPAVIFGFFVFAGFYAMAQSYGTDYPSGGEAVLIGLAGLVVMGGLLANNMIKRTAEWDENGVHFRWLTGEADLAWDEIEKIEVKPHSRKFVRIRFRDGRKFPMSAFFTGGNTLLRELQKHGAPVHRWGTSQPLS